MSGFLIWSISNGVSFDPIASAFFAKQTALGQTLTDTEKAAVNQLCIDLKTGGGGFPDGILGAFVALYPFVGGTAPSHSINLIDPNTFQITWNGTVSHDANGATGDGTSGYGDTGVVGNSTLPDFTENLSFGVYNRTAGSDGCTVISSADNVGNQYDIYPQFTDGNAYYDNGTLTARIGGSCPAGGELGLIYSLRGNGLCLAALRDQIFGTSGQPQGDLSAGSFQLLCFGAQSGVPPAEFSIRNIAFAFVGQGFTANALSAFNTAVQNFQSTLGRAV